MTAALNVPDTDGFDFEIESLLQPIGMNGVGEDPRYGDYFDAVKTEISRLSDTDYREVIKNCRLILANEGKDLRIAGYYLLAMVFCHGLKGLDHGVVCFKKLLENYGDENHPQRQTAKQQSISWLNNDKLVAFVNKLEIDGDAQRREIGEIKLKIDELNNILKSTYKDEITLWTSLKPWLTLNQLQDNTEQKGDDTEKVVNISEARIEDNINSELSFNRASENLIAYLKKQNDWIRIISISRALKWSSLKMPYNDELISKITPPRPEIFLSVKNNNDELDVESSVAKYESYFMEPGCQFYFDLQKREVDVAKRNNRTDIAQLIEDQVAILVKRIPDIYELSFNEGTPFATHATRYWLKNLISDSKQGTSKSNPAEDIQTKIDTILYNAKGLELPQQIASLDSINVANETEKYLIQLAKVDACMSSGRNDLALPLANHLNKVVEKHKLDEWDGILALQIWSKLLQIISSKKDNIESELLRIEDLKEKICAIDMEYAVNRI